MDQTHFVRRSAVTSCICLTQSQTRRVTKPLHNATNVWAVRLSACGFDVRKMYLLWLTVKFLNNCMHCCCCYCYSICPSTKIIHKMPISTFWLCQSIWHVKYCFGIDECKNRFFVCFQAGSKNRSKMKKKLSKEAFFREFHIKLACRIFGSAYCCHFTVLR